MKGNRFRMGSVGTAATLEAAACDSLCRHLIHRAAADWILQKSPSWGPPRQGPALLGLGSELNASPTSRDQTGRPGGDAESPCTCQGPGWQV